MDEVDSIIREMETASSEAESSIRDLSGMEALEQWRVQYLGRKGRLALFAAKISSVPPKERASFGKALNAMKERLTAIYEEILSTERTKPREFFTVNHTIPGKRPDFSGFHPLTVVTRQVASIFQSFGFGVHVGPEIESDFYNFVALNMPENHPARDMQDTFYLTPDQHLLLRTHTSPVQIRVMERLTPPFRIIALGKTFRSDAFDASHTPAFHQIEGLMVGEDICFSHLKGVLSLFLRKFFARDMKVRFLPSYFPFTEPSAEISISCEICGGRGCQTCGHEGWLEILGAGMVHPEVFRYAGYDPSTVTGFAFGMGVERLAMLKYGIEDIRSFFLNDIRFLSQVR
ncbi:MAG: phenylalanine--tRNA ligase subunit alpha [Candidatus Ratteibacteria bacterium]|jgi:phenylalanyl-tRNA synthetase alpha chain